VVRVTALSDACYRDVEQFRPRRRHRTSLVAERRLHVTRRGRRNMRSLLVVVVSAEKVNRA